MSLSALPYYAPQVRSSRQRKLFFTICRRQILHHAQRAFFTTAAAVPPPKYRERREPNSEPPHGGGSVVARCVSAGYPDGERLEPRWGAAESCCLVYELHWKTKFYVYSYSVAKDNTVHSFSAAPHRGSNTVFTQTPTLTRRATELSPRGSRIPFATLTLTGPTTCHLWGLSTKNFTRANPKSNIKIQSSPCHLFFREIASKKFQKMLIIKPYSILNL